MKDKTTGEYSFYNHEKISYNLKLGIVKLYKEISPIPLFITWYAKSKTEKPNRKIQSYDKLDTEFLKELKLFMKYDDLAKKTLY